MMQVESDLASLKIPENVAVWATTTHAKDRADYLLAAIGERRGKALQVYENRNGNYGLRRENRMQQAKASINQIADLFSDEQEALQFQKIKLQSSVFVRFGIE